MYFSSTQSGGLQKPAPVGSQFLRPQPGLLGRAGFADHSEICQCRQWQSAFTVLLTAESTSSLCNSIRCLKFLNCLCSSKLGDNISSTATTMLELKFSGFGTFCKAVLSGCLENSAALKVKMALYWYILSVVNRKGNPILNVEMYYTADGLYKYGKETEQRAWDFSPDLRFRFAT